MYKILDIFSRLTVPFPYREERCDEKERTIMRNAFKTAALAGASLMGALGIAGAAQAQSIDGGYAGQSYEPPAASANRFEIKASDASCSFDGHTLTVRNAHIDRLMAYGDGDKIGAKVACQDGKTYNVSVNGTNVPDLSTGARTTLTFSGVDIQTARSTYTQAPIKAAPPQANCGNNTASGVGASNTVGNTYQTSKGCFRR